jgi:hypothetical protein
LNQGEKEGNPGHAKNFQIRNPNGRPPWPAQSVGKARTRQFPGNPGMAPQAFEILESAPENGAPHHGSSL